MAVSQDCNYSTYTQESETEEETYWAVWWSNSQPGAK